MDAFFWAISWFIWVHLRCVFTSSRTVWQYLKPIIETDFGYCQLQMSKMLSMILFMIVFLSLVNRQFHSFFLSSLLFFGCLMKPFAKVTQQNFYYFTNRYHPNQSAKIQHSRCFSKIQPRWKPFYSQEHHWILISAHNKKQT